MQSPMGFCCRKRSRNEDLSYAICSFFPDFLSRLTGKRFTVTPPLIFQFFMSGWSRAFLSDYLGPMLISKEVQDKMTQWEALHGTKHDPIQREFKEL